MVMYYSLAPLVYLLAIWALYILYIAVMALRDRRDDGSLSLLDHIFGYPTLALGLVVDFVVNILLSPLFVEIPQWQRGEMILSPRLTRLAKLPKNSTGLAKWRRDASRWILTQIDHHDKTGAHGVPE